MSFEQNIEQAHTRKKTKYTYLEGDIESNGYVCNNIPFEVGSRGHLTSSNMANLSTLHRIGATQMKLKHFCRRSQRSAYCVLIQSTTLEMKGGGLTHLLSVHTNPVQCEDMNHVMYSCVGMAGNETCKRAIVIYFQL